MSRLSVTDCVVRKSFSKTKNVIPLPNLIEVQSNSFNDFVQLDFLPNERKKIGLERVFRDIFPISYNAIMSLEYVGYELGNWECLCGGLKGIDNRYTWQCSSCEYQGVSRLENGTCTKCSAKNAASYIKCKNCLIRVFIKPPLSAEVCRMGSQTFALPLKVKMQLISSDEDKDGKKTIRDVKEQEIFFLDLPVMVDIYEEDDVFKIGNTGTFIVNGVERVIVTQIHRSPGVVFAKGKKQQKETSSASFVARLIPMRGSWVDFEIDSKDILYARIDKTKKLLVTTFLQAIGFSRDEIVKLFYNFGEYFFENGILYQSLNDSCIGVRLEKSMVPATFDKTLINKKINSDILAKLVKGLKTKGLRVRNDLILNKVIGSNIVDSKTGEYIIGEGDLITDTSYDKLAKMDNVKFSVIFSSNSIVNPIIPATLALDKNKDEMSAVKEVYSRIYPGDIAPYEEMKTRIHNMFFNSRFYDMTKVGRVKINRKLGLNVSEDILHFTREDIIATIRYLTGLRERGEGEIDDIDHLGNRRVRLVGELLTNQVYSGMLRVERIIRERFRMYDSNKVIAPYDLVNVKPLAGIVREFFATGQLSQFMDQTNPLAEIAHKRRLSSLGPGGVTRDRATYEVRDVHTSHYGRICPIETPEGQAIGLILSLATFASVDKLGFLKTPYCPVNNGKLENKIEYLDAFQESGKYIVQIESVSPEGEIIDEEGKVLVRHNGNFIYVEKDKVDYADSSPNQIFSVATSMIPFLHHDDAVRALMGSNMQRQAVPLVKAQGALVGTGIEREVARTSGACIMAKHSGLVEYVSSDIIMIRADKEEFSDMDAWFARGVETYHLRVFEGSSYGTCIHHKPVVRVGDRVVKGQFLTDAPSVISGELALGTNLKVAFMPWRGYNYEDAIVLSNRVVSDDLLTSIHIEEYTVDARDTRLGPEEITADIPNVSASSLEALGEDGVVKIGTRVSSGDILVGKVTLKGDVQHSPEEKLLRAIFGEKSREVRDTSLRLPAGTEGVVVDVRVFSRSGSRKDENYKILALKKAEKLKQEFKMHNKILEDMVIEKIIALVDGADSADKKALGANKAGVYSKELLEKMSFDEIKNIDLKSASKQKEILNILKAFDCQMRVIEGLNQERLQDLRRGDSLPSGVLKMVKVYVASLRRIQVGDKIAGRHGNKGVVSLILPREDMPYMEDGTSVDVVLNPMGIISRMNVGQILETMLGFCGYKIGQNFKELIQEQKYDACKKELNTYFGEKFISELEKKSGKDAVNQLADYIAKNGFYFSAPVFDSGNYEDHIKPLLKKLNLPLTGTCKLRDGRTGDYFDQEVTVGTMYIMKLNHMVDDKLHARCVGPYSLVTQQPLGGKAQMGGQRFGEMEVWALESYGAAYTLQELLTYKSDDVHGRQRVYDALVRGEQVPESGLPESFNVLVKELQSLGLRVDLFQSVKEDVDVRAGN